MSVTETYLLAGSPTAVTLMSTELNSLTSSTTYAISTVGGSSGAFNNAVGGTTNLGGYEYGQVLCNLGSPGGTPAANTSINIWFLQSVGGTYEDGSTSVLPARPPDVVIPVRAASGAQVIAVNAIIPPGTFKVLVQNTLGQTLAASGNTITIQMFTNQAG